MYEAQGNTEKALKVGFRALEITEARLGPEDTNVSSILIRLGRVFIREGKYKEAKAYFKRSLAIIQHKLGPEHPHAADTIYELGALYLIKPEEIGKMNDDKGWAKDKAEKFFLQALEIKEKSMGSNHPDVARILNRLGSLYIERVQLNIAEQYLTRAYKIMKEKLGPYHSRVGQALKHMMTLFQSQEKVQRSIECGVEALKVFEKIGGPSSQFTIANILVLLSELYVHSEGHNSENARKNLNRALEIRMLKHGPEHPDTIHIHKLIANLRIPPPPPMPLRPLVAPKVEMIEEGERPVIDDARSQLLSDIRKRYGLQEKAVKIFNKPVLQMMKNVKKNAKDKEGWWKQNYTYKK
jgi:tetratricopeptide (TPR) repeat protein